MQIRPTHIIFTLLSLCAAVTFLSCGHSSPTPSWQERRAIDSIVGNAGGMDSLAALQEKMEEEGNKLGCIVVLREMGKRMRNESRFEDALNLHIRGLQMAKEAGDTTEWVQALNNVGTDYRRLGVIDAAQDYHYRALKLSEECADTSFAARKNTVTSLNGLGNIYLSLGNYARADSVLRLALEGEKRLNSSLGQAINYANIGSIFSHRGDYDSAWVYYRQSMMLNKKAKSKLGISLCHTYFGSLYEKQRDYGKATDEYLTAYTMMTDSKDEWHALNSLIALAGIYNTTGDDDKTLSFLSKAKAMAEHIESKEHLSSIYALYCKYYKRKGECKSALQAYERSVALQDSVLDMEKINRIQNISLNIERMQQTKEMADANLRLQQERTERKQAYLFAILILSTLFLIVGGFLYFIRMQRQTHRILKKAAKVKEEFFTNITHEFRTPLTVILGMSHDLQRNSDDAVRNKANAIERQGNALLSLINQLLDISKVQSAVGNLKWENGDITAYLAMLAESWEDYASRRGITLTFHASDNVTMDFIPDYIDKVVNNLLSNAFKFTPDDGEVTISAEKAGETLAIDVADTGTGMDRETLKHVFEPFYQGENSAAQTGSGVGLALVKQIMDSVGGTVTVESSEGKGTVFHLRLPIHNRSTLKSRSWTIAEAPIVSEPETTLTDKEEKGKDCHILIMEDNSDIASYIGGHLEQDYSVHYATNGREGMKKARDIVPELIITDIMMPEMDGLEVCRQIRDDIVTDHIPIIVVSAKTSEEERVRGLEAGADAYLAKPFNSEELLMRVNKLLERNRLMRERFRNLIDIDDAKDDDKDTVEKKIERMYGDDLPDVNDAERQFLERVTKVSDRLLDDHRLDVTTLADKLCMSPRQLYRKLGVVTGSSPTIYIQKFKIQRACHLLRSKPNMSIETIAIRCGFEHATNFYNFFKKTYGITPMEYRRGDDGEAEE